MSISTIILAAGEGKRMKSKMPKVMHEVASRSMIGHIFDMIKKVENDELVTVIGPDMEVLRQHVLSEYTTARCVVQEKRLGTADAVKTGIKELKHDNHVLVLYGDTPFITDGTISKMKQVLDSDSKNALVVLGFEVMSPNEYGRLVVNKDNSLEEIVEFLDCSLEQRKIQLCNSGVMLIHKKYVSDLLSDVKNDNAKKEYYLTALVSIAKGKGLSCQYVAVSEEEALAVNSRDELAEAEMVMQNKLREKFINEGVTLIDRETVYFSEDTEIAHDVIIYPNVFFGRGVKIHSGAVIKSFCHLEGAEVGPNATVGPFAHLRPGTILEEKVKIGNFVEVKNTKFGPYSKASHLSYLGDSDIGKSVNIGAGTITCNYDGFEKHNTKIGDESFVGSNSSIVAPVKIGSGVIIGAGSVVTDNVENDSLVVARTKQKNYLGKAKVIHNKNRKTVENQSRKPL